MKNVRYLIKKCGYVNESVWEKPLLMSNNAMAKKSCTNFSNVSGIYVWINKTNNKMYIGRATKLYRRVYEEKLAFNNKKHINLKKLYNAVMKYGIDNFNVHILLKCEREKLIDLEKCFIEYFDTHKNGYNCTDGGSGVLGHKVTDEQITKQKKKMKLYWTDTKKKEMSDKIKKLYKDRPEVLKQQKNTLKKMFESGEMQKRIKEGIKKIGKKRLKEKYKKHSDFMTKLYKESPNRSTQHSIKMKKYYKNPLNRLKVVHDTRKGKLISPGGQIVEFINVSKFCRENDLDLTSTYRVLNGEYQTHRGWKSIKFSR